MSIGSRIKDRRKQLNLTQDELADRLKTTKQTIYKYEKGIVTNLPSDRIEQLANALETTPAYLMGWEEKVYIDIKKLNKDNKKRLEEYFLLLLSSQKEGE